MTYFAYIPRADGTEPVGTQGKIIRRDLKTRRGAIRAAVAALGYGCRVYEIPDDNLYNESSWRQIK